MSDGESIQLRTARVIRNTMLRVFERTRALAANNIKMGSEQESRTAAVDASQLTMRSGRLSRAVAGARGRAGASGESYYRQHVRAAGGEAVIEWTITVPYAAAHEYGAQYAARSILMTPKMRSYLWFRSYKAEGEEKDKFRRAALKRGVTLPAFTMPARPFIGPALEAVSSHKQQILIEELQREFGS